MSSNGQPRQGEVPCPRNGACGQGKHHQVMGDQYRACLTATSREGFVGTGAVRAGSTPPPAAAAAQDLTAGVSPDTLVKVVGRHREGWMDDYRNASYAISRAIVDGDITVEQIASYPYEGGSSRAARELAEAAELDWQDPFGTEHVDHSVDALRQLLTGDTGSARIWLWEDSGAPDEHGVSAHQVSAATMDLDGIRDAAQLIVDADDAVDSSVDLPMAAPPTASAKATTTVEYRIATYSSDNPDQVLTIARTGDEQAARERAREIDNMPGQFAKVTRAESVTVVTEVDVTNESEDDIQMARVDAYAEVLFNQQNPGSDFEDESLSDQAPYLQSARMIFGV